MLSLSTIYVRYWQKLSSTIIICALASESLQGFTSINEAKSKTQKKQREQRFVCHFGGYPVTHPWYVSFWFDMD